MNEAHELELSELRAKMEKSEAFAATIPALSELILMHKFSGDEDHIKLGNRYKSLCLDRGINRNHYKSGTNREVKHLKKYHDGKLFCLHLNFMSLFDRYEKFGLEDVVERTDLFFFDQLNNKIYANDTQIGGVLEALVDWYEAAQVENGRMFQREEIAKAKADLERAEAALQEAQ